MQTKSYKRVDSCLPLQRSKFEEMQSSQIIPNTRPDDKRLVSVVEPEKEDGNIEYKRQLHKCTVNRLEKLKTQMSYRLDEGRGVCVYRIGVEDDGCHSLLDYDTCAETARVLECIARSLNAVVIERKMIQREIGVDDEGKAVKMEGSEPVSVVEPSLLGDGMDYFADDTGHHRENKFSLPPTSHEQIEKESAAYTRGELTIQRVETHLLDPSPASLAELAKGAQESIVEPTLPPSVDTPAKGDREVPSLTETLSSRNIRVAVVGNVDAGKSTMIGTLTSSLLDDGRGSSRTFVMKHRHEIESGRTSTATTHLMGFRSSGESIAGRDSIRTNRRKSEDEIARESFRLITLMDLAGHERYLKTTIHGVVSGMADYALILVNSRHPPTHMTAQHLQLCASMMPVIVVFTKMDGCPDHSFQNSKKEVYKLLRAPDVGKKPFEIRDEQNIAMCTGKLHSLAPIITTSCVTGDGINLLKKLLFALPKRRKHEKKVNRPFEFLVDDVFNVPGVGAVVSGFVNAGSLSVGSNAHVYVGPIEDGTFVKTVAKSAHIARIGTSFVTSGQSACLALALSKDMRKELRRGMVVLTYSPIASKEFEAEICVLKGEGTTIRRSYQAYVHILNVRQSAFARDIEIIDNHTSGLSSRNIASEAEAEEIILRPGSRAKVRFEFAQRPEYIRPGMRMLFRDGRVRGVGLVTGVPTILDPVGA